MDTPHLRSAACAATLGPLVADALALLDFVRPPTHPYRGAPLDALLRAGAEVRIRATTWNRRAPWWGPVAKQRAAYARSLKTDYPHAAWRYPRVGSTAWETQAAHLLDLLVAQVLDQGAASGGGVLPRSAITPVVATYHHGVSHFVALRSHSGSPAAVIALTPERIGALSAAQRAALAQQDAPTRPVTKPGRRGAPRLTSFADLANYF